ncbi:MAG: GNAT family N-acetyltransferase [Anaerolineae bacterium]|nr:GNAT family N-acetyltransferase [Anaerolineae bacterium]
MAQKNVEIRALESMQELEGLQALQHTIWQERPDYVIRAPLMTSIMANGGSVLGAFDGEQLVGGAIAMLGAASLDENRPAMANLKLASERVLVLPEYRNQGIGFHLKLAQYQFAAKRSIRLMTWLFDPLQGPYAHITVRKLGAIVSHYHADVLPATTQNSYENPDRFQAEWWLTSGRAVQRLEKRDRSPLTLDQYLDGGTRILNPSTLNDQALPVPSDSFIQPQSALGLIEIPARMEQVSRADGGLARGWLDHTRAVFGSLLNQGFVITDFVHEIHKGRPRSFYVCSHEGALRKMDRNYKQN